MEIKHTVGENQKLYELLGIDSGEHTPATEQLCEIIREMMNCHNCGNSVKCDQECFIWLAGNYPNKWSPKHA